MKNKHQICIMLLLQNRHTNRNIRVHTTSWAVPGKSCDRFIDEPTRQIIFGRGGHSGPLVQGTAGLLMTSLAEHWICGLIVVTAVTSGFEMSPRVTSRWDIRLVSRSALWTYKLLLLDCTHCCCRRRQRGRLSSWRWNYGRWHTVFAFCWLKINRLRPFYYITSVKVCVKLICCFIIVMTYLNENDLSKWNAAS